MVFIYYGLFFICLKSLFLTKWLILYCTQFKCITMKSNVFLILSLFFFINSLQAQTGRYKRAVFQQNNVLTNIEYGSADSYDIFGLNIPLPQYLDFYEPVGDTASKRPLVLVFFGGAFLIGDKNMQDMVAWCDSLTSYGYVCAAVNYRIGFNLLSTESSVRAGYRGVQDARAAVRYLKEFHQQYRIDTNLIFMAGNSAGSINAIQAAYGAESDRPASTYGLPGTLDDNDDLGCLDCSGNNYQHTVDLAGVIGCWGAVIDLNGLDTGDTTPIIMFHGTDDTTVPIDSGAPFGGNGIFPTMYGSKTIHENRLDLGLPSELHVYPGQPHNFYYDVAVFPNNYWDTIWQLSHPFLCDLNPYCASTISVQSIADEVTIQLYPNPAQEKLTIQCLNTGSIEEKIIRVYDLLGRELLVEFMRDSVFEIDVSAWRKGIYIVEIKLDGEWVTEKIKIE